MIKARCAGGIVINYNKQVAVVSQTTAWSLPKWHIDPWEDPITAAKREIYEETWIKNLELLEDLGSYQRYKTSLDGGNDKSEHKTIFMFLFKTDQKQLKPIDPHNPEAIWVSKEKVSTILTHKKDQEFFLKNISKI